MLQTLGTNVINRLLLFQGEYILMSAGIAGGAYTYVAS